MHQLEVLDKLRSLKSLKSKKNFLSKIPYDHEFWYGAWFAMDVFKACFPLLSDIQDPLEYSNGPPHGTFKRILAGGLSQLLSGPELIRAIQMFSVRCTEEEWLGWYKPIITGQMIIPLSPEEFIDIAPEPYKDLEGNPSRDNAYTFRRLESLKDDELLIPWCVEPYNDAPRVIWFFGPNTVAFDLNGRRIDHPLLEKTKEIYERSRMTLVADLYVESEEILIVRDLIPADVFFNGMGHRELSLKERQEGAEQVVGLLNSIGIIGADMIERYYIDKGGAEYLRSNASMFFEQGYSGLVFVQEPGRVVKERPVVGHPTKKSVVTCLDIISGEDEYEGKAEYIWCRGTINKKSFRTRVYYGLNWEQRDTYFKDRDNLIGKKFEIISCGVTDSGKIILPIFKQWR